MPLKDEVQDHDILTDIMLKSFSLFSAYQYLKYKGFLCLEIGFDQKIDVIELIENTNNFDGTYSKKDLYDNDRIIITQMK